MTPEEAAQQPSTVLTPQDAEPIVRNQQADARMESLLAQMQACLDELRAEVRRIKP